MEVSAHAGARPEHAVWQGKIYSRSGTSEKYPDFRSSTGYGTGAGLCGWNCRHTFGPYIEGSPRIWTDEKLEELNAPKYEYNGEQFTEYEARQKEKYFDRQIFRWQREAAAMKAAGLDDSEARAKVKAWTAKKQDFLQNRMDLPVAKSQNGGIINAVSDALTPVTDASIRNLKVPSIPGFSEDICKRFYEAEKELLQDVQKLEVGTELAKICMLDGAIVNTLTGPSGGGSVRVQDPGFDCVVLHNHPDNRIFSGRDIETFLNSGDIQVFSAIGNDGKSSYILAKKSDYDGFEASRAFYPLISKLEGYKKTGDIDSYIETIEQFLGGVNAYGAVFKRT